MRQVNSSLEYPYCNNCHSKKYSIFYKNVTTWEYPGRFQIVKCKNCGLVYLNPRPKRESIGKYYHADTYWGHDLVKNNNITNWKSKREEEYKYLYSEILKKRKNGAIFDVGAGTGVFLSKFKELGWSINGIEFSPDAVKFAKKKYGIILKTGDFLDYKFKKNSFDIVTLNNALEHLYYPLETLKEIKKVVKKDGIIVIVVPNIESFGAKIYKKNWHALQVPKHLYHFSPKTLSNVLDNAGFNILKISYSYRTHNYYSLFESFRFMFSPRFKKFSGGGVLNNGSVKKQSFIKEVGKVFARIFATIMVFVEKLFKSSDVIVVYATPKN